MSLRVDPAQISFDHVGDKIPINVWGRFADGSNLYLTESSLVGYRSNDARIATVDKNGVVTAIGAGTTATADIVIQFSDRTVRIPVSVRELNAPISQSLRKTPEAKAGICASPP